MGRRRSKFKIQLTSKNLFLFTPQPFTKNDGNFYAPTSSHATQNQNLLLHNQPWQQPSSIDDGKIDFNYQSYQPSESFSSSSSSHNKNNFLVDDDPLRTNFIPRGRSLDLSDENKEIHNRKRRSTEPDSNESPRHKCDRRDLYSRIAETSPL